MWRLWLLWCVFPWIVHYGFVVKCLRFMGVVTLSMIIMVLSSLWLLRPWGAEYRKFMWWVESYEMGFWEKKCFGVEFEIFVLVDRRITSLRMMLNWGWYGGWDCDWAWDWGQYWDLDWNGIVDLKVEFGRIWNLKMLVSGVSKFCFERAWNRFGFKRFKWRKYLPVDF